MSPMMATWTFHRFGRSSNRSIDTPDAEAVAGVLAPAKPEIEATLSLDAVFSIRDTVWPLAWRLCLEPLPAVLSEGQAQWQYRCFDSPTQVMLRAADDRVYVRRDAQPEIAFLASELWPALVAGRCRLSCACSRRT